MPRENAPVVRFRSPIVSLENEPMIIIDQNAKGIDVRNVPSQTYSDSMISFSELSSGGTSNIIDRKIFVEYGYGVSIAPSAADATVLRVANGANVPQITARGPGRASFVRPADDANLPVALNSVLTEYLNLCGIGAENKVGPRAFE